MVKHNNVIPNIHCHKKYCESSRGPLKVRVSLNQASKKKSRRMARAVKAAAMAPRPVQKLRPIVRAQTQRYNSKVRLGRGFTLAELKEAGIAPGYARTIGVAVDHRRSNRSMESLKLNVARLEEYKSKLVVWGKEKPSETPDQLQGTVMPLTKPESTIVMDSVTDDMKSFKAFTTMRLARQETRVAGFRVAVENRKKKD